MTSSAGREAHTTPLRDIARLFLKLGTIGFGGPAAHIAMMEEEVVRRRAWLTRDQFLDYLGATNLIPGPNSTELAIHIGHARGGWPGLFVAGIAFILPATLIVTAAAWGYVRYGWLPQVEGLLYGVKPVVMAVIAQALWNLGRSAVKSRGLAIIGIAAILAASTGVHELIVLAATGAVTAILQLSSRTRRASLVPVLAGAWSEGTALTAAGSVAISTSIIPVSLWPLFLVFVKAGAVLFGSGYVLLAFLRADLVPGAVLATLLWVAASLAFKFYVSNFTDYNASYGAAGAVMVLLGWFYISGLAILLGAELNAEIEHASPWGKKPGEKVPGQRKKIGVAAARAYEERRT
jgi:chromate transporter